MDNIRNSRSCPCSSGKTYEECCGCFHNGKEPGTALELMRSRYSAYAMCLPDYIIKTTDINNPNFQMDTKKWKKEIEIFSELTSFEGLDIIDFSDGETEATVTFRAHLVQSGIKNPLTEKSYFRKAGGKWLYLKGDFY